MRLVGDAGDSRFAQIRAEDVRAELTAAAYDRELASSFAAQGERRIARDLRSSREAHVRRALKLVDGLVRQERRVKLLASRPPTRDVALSPAASQQALDSIWPPTPGRTHAAAPQPQPGALVAASCAAGPLDGWNITMKGLEARLWIGQVDQLWLTVETERHNMPKIPTGGRVLGYYEIPTGESVARWRPCRSLLPTPTVT